MNKQFLALSLLCSAIIAEHMHYIVIDSPVLQFVDGKPVINLSKILIFRKKLRELHFLEKLIKFKDVMCSIKDLTELEKIEGMSPELRVAFDQAIGLFADLAIPYMKDAEGSEDIIRKLVDQWSIQRNRPHTFLLEWSRLTTHAQALFYKNIKNFNDLTLFLEDLETFLGDLIQSCPKSLEQLKKAKKH